MARRSELLEFAVLGLLHESPMHGYELRKRLALALGAFRAISYGSLYPCLRGLLERGWIAEASGTNAAGPVGSPLTPVTPSRRGRIVYELTAVGKEHFQDLVAEIGPTAWDDEEFGTRLAFFARTPAQVRLRILEGRRSRLHERLALVREASMRNRARIDDYTLALQRHGEETTEREMRWLDELIANERTASDPRWRHHPAQPGGIPASGPDGIPADPPRAEAPADRLT